MSNLGLRLAMERSGINVHETQVGDRYVLEALNEHQWSLGGEQSGHIIFPDTATTGDGVLAGLRLASFLKRTGKPLSQLAGEAMTKLPQVLRNVRIATRGSLDDATEIWDEVRLVERELGHTGRVLLRPSGTEPLVRVMIEAPTIEDAEAMCQRLCDVVARVLLPANS
jgi:phosphoglucosamine mutase